MGTVLVFFLFFFGPTRFRESKSFVLIDQDFLESGGVAASHGLIYLLLMRFIHYYLIKPQMSFVIEMNSL